MTIKGALLIAMALAGAYVSTTYVREDKNKNSRTKAAETFSLEGKWKPVGYTATRFDSLEFRENFIILKLKGQDEPDIRRYTQNLRDRLITIDEKFGDDSVMSYRLNGDDLELRAAGVGQTLEWKRQ